MDGVLITLVLRHFHRFRRSAVAGIALAFAVAQIKAQINGVDLSFDPGSGPTGSSTSYRGVTAAAIQGDNKVLIAGDFTKFNDTPRNYLARLNENGSVDDTFLPDSRLDWVPLTLVLQPDGKIVVAGDLVNYNGDPRPRIARFNSDGSLDLSFTPGSGADDAVMAVALQSDGKILVAGYFNHFDGVSRQKLARLNPDGTLDQRFDAKFGPNGAAACLGFDGVNRILVGGSFDTLTGQPSRGIARLNSDGNVDESFNPGSGIKFGGIFYSLAVSQNAGKVLVAGNFDSINGVARASLARFNSDGSLDPDFALGGVPRGEVRSIALQGDGKAIIADNLPREILARINRDGTVDSSFQPGTVQTIP